jgi:hypothetical protein
MLLDGTLLDKMLIDEMLLDETLLDKMSLDETLLDERTSYPENVTSMLIYFIPIGNKSVLVRMRN